MAEPKIHVYIKYTETSIIFEFYPGCANFDYWLNKKVDADRWKQTGNGIWLGCEVTAEEAKYIEGIAVPQFDKDGVEVIRKPVIVDEQGKQEELEEQPTAKVEEKVGQLLLL